MCFANDLRRGPAQAFLPTSPVRSRAKVVVAEITNARSAGAYVIGGKRGHYFVDSGFVDFLPAEVDYSGGPRAVILGCRRRVLLRGGLFKQRRNSPSVKSSSLH